MFPSKGPICIDFAIWSSQVKALLRVRLRGIENPDDAPEMALSHLNLFSSCRLVAQQN
jgi:hypothetical protein